MLNEASAQTSIGVSYAAVTINAAVCLTFVLKQLKTLRVMRGAKSSPRRKTSSQDVLKIPCALAPYDAITCVSANAVRELASDVLAAMHAMGLATTALARVNFC